MGAIHPGAIQGVPLRTTPPFLPNTGKDWIEEFAAGLAREDLSPKTILGYRQDLKGFVQWLQAVRGTETDLSQLSSIDLIQYRQHLLHTQQRKPTTINRHLQALRRFCRWGKGCGIFQDDPSAGVRAVRLSPRRRPLGLTELEVYALVRAAMRSGPAQAKRNYALVQLMLQAGLRTGEIAALCAGDIKLGPRSGSVRVRHGKGGKEREVPLNASARRALGQYLEASRALKPEDPVFVSLRGRAMSVRSIQYTISSLARRAKVTRIHLSPHTLRHTFALNYLRHNSGKLVELASLLGHDSLDTTALYTQPSLEELAEDLERSPLNVYE